MTRVNRARWRVGVVGTLAVAGLSWAGVPEGADPPRSPAEVRSTPGRGATPRPGLVALHRLRAEGVGGLVMGRSCEGLAASDRVRPVPADEIPPGGSGWSLVTPGSLWGVPLRDVTGVCVGGTLEALVATAVAPEGLRLCAAAEDAFGPSERDLTAEGVLGWRVDGYVVTRQLWPDRGLCAVGLRRADLE